MKLNKYENIDLVIVNFYPFEKTLKKSKSDKTIIENIDIGGPTLVRAAAKNFNDVTIITNPEQYKGLIGELQKNRGATSFLQNKKIDYILFELQETILQSINRTSKEVFEPIFNAGYQIMDLNGNLMLDSSDSIPNGDYLACLDGTATAKKLAVSNYELI